MTLIRNTIVFLDTKFFREYKPKDALYRKVFDYSKNKKINLCTSYICLEEWRTQKVSHLTKIMQDMTQKLVELPATNFIANKILDPELHQKFPDNKQIIDQSKSGIDVFAKDNNLHVYRPREEHIWSTWSAYFHGENPFKGIKNRKDIPDAWIFECAKDALSDEVHKNIHNKFCIGGDTTLCDAFENLGFKLITLLELVEMLEKEEAGEIQEPKIAISEKIENVEQQIEEAEKISLLDALLAKTITATDREIYLRLLGFVVALDTPSHDSLINTVVSKGFTHKLTEACAVILSSSPEPYIKDTGSHYVVGNKEICEDAAERLTQEIIDLLEQA